MTRVPCSAPTDHVMRSVCCVRLQAAPSPRQRPTVPQHPSILAPLASPVSDPVLLAAWTPALCCALLCCLVPCRVTLAILHRMRPSFAGHLVCACCCVLLTKRLLLLLLLLFTITQITAEGQCSSAGSEFFSAAAAATKNRVVPTTLHAWLLCHPPQR